MLKILIYLTVAFAALNPAVAVEITLLTHSIEGKTFVDANGELRGIKHAGRRAFQLELIREMMIAQDISPHNFNVIPFKRGLKLIRDNEKPYALFNISFREDRKGKMKFVGPLSLSTTYLYELKSEPTGIKKIEQAKDFTLCVLRGTNLVTFAERKGFHQIIQHNHKGCFRMLIKKRVDFVAIANLELDSVLKSSNIERELIQNTSVYLYETEDSLAFANQVPDSVVRNWQSALDAIKQTGRYDELRKAYLLPE